MSHTCHAPGCSRQVPPRMFACKEHWFALPKAIRDAIWREYRSGQEVDKKPSPRYMAVQRYACARLAFKPNDEKAANAASCFVLEATTWQRRCIAMGLGDPLAGLLPKNVDMGPPQKQDEQAGTYLRRIRNRLKRAYAERFWAYLQAGAPTGKEPHRGGLSYMAAQAVQIRLREIIEAAEEPSK